MEKQKQHNENDLIIRPARENEYTEIAGILKRILSNRSTEDLLSLWKWRFQPEFAHSEDLPGFYVGEAESKIVGVHGLYPSRLKIDKQIISMVCMSDFAVVPEARSKGYGSKIRIRVLGEETSPFIISTSSNTHGNKLTLILGGVEIRESRKSFVMPLAAKSFIQKALQKSGLTRIFSGGLFTALLAIPVDIYLSIGRMLAPVKEIPGAVIENIEVFDDRFDLFWKKASDDYPVLFVRDSAYLNWRYSNYPLNKYDSFALIRDNEILGIAVMYIGSDKNGIKFASIMELFTRKESVDEYKKLLAEVVGRAVKNKCQYIKTISSVNEHQRLLRSFGFRERQMNYAPYTYKDNTGYSEKLLRDSRNWHISLGDGDMCFY